MKLGGIQYRQFQSCLNRLSWVPLSENLRISKLRQLYPLARCARLDTLDFSCTVAFMLYVADFPEDNSLNQGLWEGKKPGKGKGIEKKMISNFTLKAEVSSSGIAWNMKSPWLLTCSYISFLVM